MRLRARVRRAWGRSSLRGGGGGCSGGSSGARSGHASRAMRSPAAPVLVVLWLLRTMAAVDGAATTVVVGGANDPDYYDEGETGLEETTPDGAEPGQCDVG